MKYALSIGREQEERFRGGTYRNRPEFSERFPFAPGGSAGEWPRGSDFPPYIHFVRFHSCQCVRRGL
jgi:hypothetical protein